MNSERVITDMDDVPFAVEFRRGSLQGMDDDSLKGHVIRVRPSDDHEFTKHKVVEVEDAEDEDLILLRLSAPLEA